MKFPACSNLLALAFCVVVTVHSSNVKWYPFNVRCQCHLKNKGKRFQSFQGADSHDSEMDLISDSVFVWYDAFASNRILKAIEESRANYQAKTLQSNAFISILYYTRRNQL